MELVQLVTIISLIIFSGVMVSIGVYSKRHAKTVEDFLIGGRKIGAWMSAFSYGTSYFSAVIFIGYAGKQGWDIGLAGIWIGVGNALLGCLLAWLVLARKTRVMTHELNVKTMPEFFEARYKSSAMKIFASLIIFVFLVPYSSAVYKGLGSMFNTIFPNVPVNVCMLLIAVITAFFLVMGGYVASVLTDFFQGIIMIFGVIMMVLLATYSSRINGFGDVYAKLTAISPSLTNITGGSSFKFLCINILLTSFGTWGLPQMINKYYAIKDEASIKKAAVVSTSFAAIIGVGAYYVGSLGRIYLDNTLPQGGYDFVVPNLLVKALGGAGLLSTIVLAIILMLLLSASMSTLSAIVLTSSSVFSVDLLPYIFPSLKKAGQMTIMRVLCLVFVGLSFMFATVKIAIIVSIMSFSWGAVSGTFIGPYIWGLYLKKVTRTAAWAGMLGGFGTICLLTLYQTLTNSFASAMANAPIYGVTAMAVSVVAVPVVTLVNNRFRGL